MEFTPNFNGNDGGFLVDPDAPSSVGRFGVGIGRGDSAQQRVLHASRRRRVAPLRARAGLDQAGCDADHAVRRRSGRELPEARQRHGCRAVRQLRAELHVARRRLAVRPGRPRRGRGLQPGAERGHDRRPLLQLGHQPPAERRLRDLAEPRPSPARRSRSTPPARPIPTARSPTTSGISTATGPTSSRAPPPPSAAATPRATSPTVKLRVTDDLGGHRHRDPRLVVANTAPTASFTATPNPAQVGASVAFNASASSDPDGTIAKYEWDLDGNGSYETDTGTTKTPRRASTARRAQSRSGCGSPTTTA